MLYYWLHLVYVYIGSKFFWKKVDLDADLTRKRRVNILDCEAFRYMSNAKYFYYMDLIRFEILFRSKLHRATFAKGIYPTLASQKIIYKRPLKRWNKFSITLVLEGWDDKWVYHRQVFSRNGEVYAVGFTKVTFIVNKKAINMPELLAECGITTPQKHPSKDVLDLFDEDYELLKSS